MRENGPETAQEVYILLVETGRTGDDGLPDGATGAAMMCYAAGRDERNAVDETVRVLREAGMAPLEVTSYGTREDTELELGEDELALMDRALAENAVIVAQVTMFGDEDADDGEVGEADVGGEDD